MIQLKKKLTNMVWRSMGESILLGLLLFSVVTYLLHYNGLLRPFISWGQGVIVIVTAVAAVVVLSGAFGYWQSNRMKNRLEQLQEAMLLLERGILSREVTVSGEDEIGRLAEQLDRISKKWEEQVSSLQRLSTNNAELAERAKLSAVVEERQRLARDLHDAVSQQLFAISMTSTALGRILDKDFEKAKRQVALIEEMAAVAQSEMRALLLHLRPVHLEGKLLADGLRELIGELRAKVPMDISLEIDENIRFGKGIEDHLFRIVQEALSNALRHSKASKMDFKLTHRSDVVRLSIRDNGVGFDLNIRKHASYGIVSMQERVNEIGGSMDIITAPGRGTRIEIRIPWKGTGEEETGYGIHDKGTAG